MEPTPKSATVHLSMVLRTVCMDCSRHSWRFVST